MHVHTGRHKSTRRLVSHTAFRVFPPALISSFPEFLGSLAAEQIGLQRPVGCTASVPGSSLLGTTMQWPHLGPTMAKPTDPGGEVKFPHSSPPTPTIQQPFHLPHNPVHRTGRKLRGSVRHFYGSFVFIIIIIILGVFFVSPSFTGRPRPKMKKREKEDGVPTGPLSTGQPTLHLVSVRISDLARG